MAGLASIEKYRKFVTSLSNKTKQEKIEWSETSIDGVYSTTLSGFTVHIRIEKSITSPSADDVFISIHDEWGEEKDHFSDVTIRGETPEGYDGYYSLMEELYRMAARQASGADQIMDQLLDAISEV